MNVDQTVVAMAIKSTSKTSTTSTPSSTKTSSSSSSSFQDEMDSVKTQDSQADSSAQSAQAAQSNDSSDKAQKAQSAKDSQTSQKTDDTAKTEQEKTEQKAKTDLTNQSTEIENKQNADAVKELSAKIAKINEIKNGTSLNQTQGASKTEDTKDKNSNYCQTMKMNGQDAMFFVNLVNNQQMTAQSGQSVDLNGNKIFTDIKAQATQSTVKVSATLMDALNDSVKTGKPFRIDFDNNIAVVMKVDKQGVLSANFIPGSAAVENYLKNNIDGLRQSFDEQNLPYNDLSYSQQQKREQKDGSNKKEKNSDE